MYWYRIMRSEIVLITAIIVLGILGVVVSCTQPEASKLIYAIVGIIGAIAGVTGHITVPKLMRRFKK